MSRCLSIGPSHGSREFTLSVCVRHATHAVACYRARFCRPSFGKPLYSSPSSSLPPDFDRSPPHCLKKKGTPVTRHWSLTSLAHLGSIGRAFGPLSPPTMTQWMPSRSIRPIGVINGSTERKRTLARVSLRCCMRDRLVPSSTETPSQM